MYFFLFYYNKMKDIISYYEEGGNSNTPADVGDEMKTQAKEWMKRDEDESEGVHCKLLKYPRG